MKKYAGSVLILFFLFSTALFAGKQAGSVAQIKGKDVIVRYVNAGSPLRIGERITAATTQGDVVLEVVFPMQSAAKCKVLSGDISFLSTGDALSFAQSDSREVSENLLFPVDGVFPGKTTAKELSKRAKKLTDTTPGKPKGYDINGAQVLCDRTSTMVKSYYITQYNTMPQKWQDLGMSFNLSYDEWTALLRKLEWKITVIDAPRIERSSDKDSFRAELQAQYADNGMVYLLSLRFNYGEGTTASDKNTLYSIEASFASKYDQKVIDAIAEGTNALFPLDGVSIGTTTPYQLGRIGTRIPDKEKGIGSVGYGQMYIVNEIPVCCDKNNRFATFYCFFRRDYIPYPWQIIGIDLDLSYDEWLQLAGKMGWDVSVTEEPHVEDKDGVSSFTANVTMRIACDGTVSLMKLRFGYSTGTLSSDKGTLFNMSLAFDSHYDQKEVDDVVAGNTRLFPLNGLIPGKTTSQELAKRGKRKSDSKGKILNCYDINNCDAWYNDKLNVFTNFLFIGSDNVPEKWHKLGIDWKLSFNDWVELGNKMGWIVKTKEKPNVETQGDDSWFKAQLEIYCPQDDYTSVLTLTFRSREKTSEYDEGTLLMISAGISDFDMYRLKASRGDAESQYNLSILYQNGDETEKNLDLAAQWCLKAANAGYIRAEYNMGCYYYSGDGVEEDKKKAFMYFMRAANKGYPKALYNLGYCYSKGEGTDENKYKAVECWKKAAAKNDMDAMNNLGSCYEFGTGIAQNMDKAIELYKKAAELGNEKAKENLSRLGISY